jgi:hypothetical protein
LNSVTAAGGLASTLRKPIYQALAPYNASGACREPTHSSHLHNAPPSFPYPTTTTITTITPQDGQRHSQRIAPTKLSRGSLQVVSFVRNERPFRKDYKDQTSIAQDFKRGAKNAQVRCTQGP